MRYEVCMDQGGVVARCHSLKSAIKKAEAQQKSGTLFLYIRDTDRMEKLSLDEAKERLERAEFRRKLSSAGAWGMGKRK